MLRYPAPPARPLLTRVPLSDAALPVLDDLPWPWPGRHLAIGAIGGETLHVRDTPGQHPDAPRAVYLHGLGGSATNWTELAGLLACRADGLAVDLPGFGLSPPPANGDFRMSTQADTIAAVVAATGGGPVHLFGNSMGGAIALLLADRRPDLVRSLTLVSPAMPDLRLDIRRMSDPRMALAVLPFVGRSARRALAALTARERTEQLPGSRRRGSTSRWPNAPSGWRCRGPATCSARPWPRSSGIGWRRRPGRCGRSRTGCGYRRWSSGVTRTG